MKVSASILEVSFFERIEGNIVVRRGFSLIGSGVEDQISEITIFNFITYSGSPMSDS